MARLPAPAAKGDPPRTARFPRSLLIVPAGDEARLAAALASPADALIVDLGESAVAETLARLRAAKPRQRLYVRILGLDSGRAETDLEAAMAAMPDAIALAACRDGAEVQRLGARLAVLEARHGLADGATRILAFIETAQGLIGLSSYRSASSRLIGLAWNAATLAADLGAAPDAGPQAFARASTLIGAVAAGLAPIDTAFVGLGDEAGLKAEAEAARRDGFVAKLAIDPAQAAIINAVFAASPSRAATD